MTDDLPDHPSGGQRHRRERARAVGGHRDRAEDAGGRRDREGPAPAEERQGQRHEPERQVEPEQPPGLLPLRRRRHRPQHGAERDRQRSCATAAPARSVAGCTAPGSGVARCSHYEPAASRSRSGSLARPLLWSRVRDPSGRCARRGSGDETRGMITVDGVTKTYGAHRAVDDVSFVAQPGRVTGFLGPNGAGKSTTMRIMVGLTPASSGRVTIGGSRLRRPPQPGPARRRTPRRLGPARGPHRPRDPHRSAPRPWACPGRGSTRCSSSSPSRRSRRGAG